MKPTGPRILKVNGGSSSVDILAASDHKSAADVLTEGLEEQSNLESVRAVGHRVVRGMQCTAHELGAKELLEELHPIIPWVPERQPREIERIEALRQRHPKLPQAACFDTPFHRDMPRVAKPLSTLPRYEVKGV